MPPSVPRDRAHSAPQNSGHIVSGIALCALGILGGYAVTAYVPGISTLFPGQEWLGASIMGLLAVLCLYCAIAGVRQWWPWRRPSALPQILAEGDTFLAETRSWLREAHQSSHRVLPRPESWERDTENSLVHSAWVRATWEEKYQDRALRLYDDLHHFGAQLPAGQDTLEVRRNIEHAVNPLGMNRALSDLSAMLNSLRRG